MDPPKPSSLPSRNINYYFMQFIILCFCIDLEQLDVLYFCPLITSPLPVKGAGEGDYTPLNMAYTLAGNNTLPQFAIECPLLTYLHFCIKLK